MSSLHARHALRFLTVFDDRFIGSIKTIDEGF
jgi:hypothetical protein